MSDISIYTVNMHTVVGKTAERRRYNCPSCNTDSVQFESAIRNRSKHVQTVLYVVQVSQNRLRYTMHGCQIMRAIVDVRMSILVSCTDSTYCRRIATLGERSESDIFFALVFTLTPLNNGNFHPSVTIPLFPTGTNLIAYYI